VLIDVEAISIEGPTGTGETLGCNASDALGDITAMYGPAEPQAESVALAWHRVAGSAESPEGRVKTVTAGRRTIALTHFEGQYGALSNSGRTRAARSARARRPIFAGTGDGRIRPVHGGVAVRG
jgi:hypothetical protein